jgi:hypothetical protein
MKSRAEADVCVKYIRANANLGTASTHAPDSWTIWPDGLPAGARFPRLESPHLSSSLFQGFSARLPKSRQG